MNKGVIVGGAIALVVVALVAGALIGPKVPIVANLTGPESGAFAGPGSAGDRMPQLTEAQRSQMEGMSDEERRAFLREQMGDDTPLGGAGGAGGGLGRGGRSLEGQVLEVASDSFTLQTTDGGSQTIYLDDTTTVAYAKGAEQDGLAAGSTIIVVAQPEADNVMNATAVIVK